MYEVWWTDLVSSRYRCWQLLLLQSFNITMLGDVWYRAACNPPRWLLAVSDRGSRSPRSDGACGCECRRWRLRPCSVWWRWARVASGRTPRTRTAPSCPCSSRSSRSAASTAPRSAAGWGCRPRPPPPPNHPPHVRASQGSCCSTVALSVYFYSVTDVRSSRLHAIASLQLFVHIFYWYSRNSITIRHYMWIQNNNEC